MIARLARLRRPAGVVALAAAASLLAGCVSGAPAEPQAAPVPYSDVHGLPEGALAVMNQPQYAHGRWLISVKDIDTGEVLIDLDADKMVEPGSFVKTYSAGAAWLTWGPDHTITTPVKRTGDVADGTLAGDLVLVGMGDLTMGGRTKPDGTVDFTNLDHNDANPLPGATLTTEDPLAGLDELAAQVKAAGIDSVAGDVLVDDRLFSGELENQPISPIIINQNILDVLITPGAVGETATAALTPAVAPWTVVSEVETVEAGGETAISAPVEGTDGTLTVTGTVAADAGPQLKVYAFDDPATFARTAFIEALGRAGVAVTTDPLATNSTAALPAFADVEALPSVAEIESLPLGEEITYVMKISYNRGAQTLVCRLAVQAGSDDCDDGMAEENRIWKEAGLDVLGASLVDGSGLDGNVITPENAVQIQTLLAERPDAERWRDTLPILGVDGSLADVASDSPAAGKVFAKTGTLLGYDAFNDRYRLVTKALGGVMDSEDGRHLAFTIAVNQGFFDDAVGVFSANDDVGAVAALIQQAW
ncbi:D-alanyl-D-alanine carboxypeptidase/D-alanyl-D-alanine-endopeptidase [Herbiconiux moechotypicola]|uniref:D-alanyl-D-alanine carboxypeptidase/D-alanyl-D-alanine-endopeptidase n=1 Tax=Herbiconiux moechotypicola TaxID=637393 RepID=A0ABN3E4Y5_9MICO|nr:D-alanyl-D-alanine carboxypeptidase/D-alanyl-D-alanine-endopeptidase [Herbiconiux moechotypicola]MCS5731802.1 D-alanyl-D-alanine carboxypeptidase/D-alanyl-D-alanine-endopeptidase [Herbiconiux moechotypicola]